MQGKVIGGAMGGVFLPIVIEFGAKGKRISEQVPLKWSGVVGVGTGIVTGVLPAVWPDYPLTKDMSDDNKNAVMAFGGASFATGLSILILDELRKRELYEFREELPLEMPGSRSGLEVPGEELLKEI